KHSVFGKVVSGQDVVDAIRQGDSMDKVEILKIGTEAEAFNARKVFAEAMEDIIDEKKRKEEDARAEIEVLTADFHTTDSGLRYRITTSGTGAPAQKGKPVAVHYRGSLIN